MTPSVLAEFLSVRRSVVTRVLANLEDRGFIERKTSSEDGRSQVLRIAEPGIVVSEYIEKIFHDEMLEAIDFLEDDHAKRMLAGLDIL